MFNLKPAQAKSYRSRIRCYGALGGLLIAIMTATPMASPVSAQLFNSALDQLPAIERDTLRNGNVTVSADGGQFVGRVLIDASTSTAWQVLTDYDNFDQFLPNVESSQLIESSGDRYVFEQVSVVRIFPITKRVEVTIAATEQHPQQISFSMVDGDAKSIQGSWRIDPVAPYSGATPNQVLVTHQVAIEPEGGALARNLFYDTYRGVLGDTLAAIQAETEQRAR
ncbi:MAG: SRPBCC family protein [Cyanobacteria bacterium P01_F01_bin.150]